MNIKLLSLLASVAIIALAGPACAKDRVTLTAVQMDKVTAGTSATLVIAGAAAGDIIAATAGTAATAVLGLNAAAAGNVVSVASSFTPGPGAAAVSALSALLTSP